MFKRKLRESKIFLRFIFVLAFVYMSSGCAGSLISATVDNDIDRVRELIIKGSDVNIKSEEGLAPLHNATYKKNVEITKLLINNGADVDVTSKNGVSPIHNATYENKNNYEIVKYLIDKGASVNVSDINGITPLHNSATSKNFEVTELLLLNGSNANEKSKEGITPLLCATCDNKNDFGIVKLLVEHGADVNITSDNGVTPLHHSTYSGNYKISNFLLSKGANVNARNVNGLTPLHNATLKNVDRDLVRLLMDSGAEINACSNLNITPLHNAVYGGNLEVIKMLVENGANINAKDINGYSPLHIASAVGSLEMVKYLILKGANCKLKTKDGYSAFKIACQSENRPVVRYIFETFGDEEFDNITPVDIEISGIKYHVLGDYFLSIRERDKARDCYLQSISFYRLTKNKYSRYVSEIERIASKKIFIQILSPLISMLSGIQGHIESKQLAQLSALKDAASSGGGINSYFQRVNEIKRSHYSDYDWPKIEINNVVDRSNNYSNSLDYSNEKVDMYSNRIVLIEGIIKCIEGYANEQSMEICVKRCTDIEQINVKK